MHIYIITIIVTAVLALLVEHTKQKRIALCLMATMPILIAGLRGVGTDYYGYFLRYEKVLNGIQVDSDGTDLSGVFYKTIIFLGNVFFDYQSVIFIISILTIGIAFFTFFKLREDLSFSFAVFSYMTLLYLYSFNLFRQFLSAELFIFGMLLIRLRKKPIAAIFMLLSILVHSSSVIYFLIYILFLFIKKNNRMQRIIYISTFIFIGILPCIAPAINGLASIFPHYAYYFLHFKYMGIGLGVFRYLFLVWIPILLLNSKKNVIDGNIVKEYSDFVFMAMMGSIFSLLSYVSDTFLYRIGYTGLCSLPIVLALFIKKLKRNKKIVVIIMITIHLVFFAFDFVYLNTGEVVPYTTFWR